MDMIFEERAMGDLLLWTPPAYQKERELTSAEKIKTEKLEHILGEKAEVRADECWEYGCSKTPIHFVREVQFDMKNEGRPVFRQVSTADFSGPIPGFCIAHIGTGPAHLAEAVYFSRPEMQWGLKPNRWFLIFSDGTKTGGDCLALDPKQEQPTIVQETIHG